ncbi:phosphonoacetaldehyde hydrolase [Gleimia hominis]|uniref:phosphonoacetaldehyde hydrolase n=1 Tax=Gleimia hominis TaxID=595468 RepID=UPI000C80F1E0|nr:phosphonoacetaldehyde hydrolase [Gleimia hominis]WIK64151.1 phosphonoacetaldehyde hydrolase [Gleimia hominis]
MASKRFDAVVFDWAGTTVDYGCFAPVQAFMDAFKEFGVEPTVAQTREPMGMSKRDHVATMLKMEGIANAWQQTHGSAASEADVDAVYARFEPNLFAILEQFAAPKPHVLDAVASLRDMGVKIGSTTGYTDQMMHVVAPKAAELGYEPDCWFSADSTNGFGRPYPYMVFRNLEALHCQDVRRVVKVGDTVSDIQEGKNAGVFTVGVVEGSSAMALSATDFNALSETEQEAARQQVRSVFVQAGADAVIDNMAQLPGLVADQR